MSYSVNWTPEKKEQALKMITKFLEQYGVGESIMLNDDATIEAPELLSDIADKVLKDNEGIKRND